MRWSRRGADLLLQVRCAVYNGALGSGFGQLFEAAPSSGLHWAQAARPQHLDGPEGVAAERVGVLEAERRTVPSKYERRRTEGPGEALDFLPLVLTVAAIDPRLH